MVKNGTLCTLYALSAGRTLTDRLASSSFAEQRAEVFLVGGVVSIALEVGHLFGQVEESTDFPLDGELEKHPVHVNHRVADIVPIDPLLAL